MLQLCLLALCVLHHCVQAQESFISQYPASLMDDEDSSKMYLIRDGQDLGLKQSETRRRSTLDKNFARFGRSGGALGAMALEDLEDLFERPTRSGEKSDQFIRFGRGKSDFVRFGRNQNFVRFGRSKSPAAEERKKREIRPQTKDNNFVRFGRNENFMRFGRPDSEKLPLWKNHSSLMKVLLKLLQKQKQQKTV